MTLVLRIARRLSLNRCWVPRQMTGARAGNEDGIEGERSTSAVDFSGRPSSWIDDRTEKICALDEGRADRCWAAAPAVDLRDPCRSGSPLPKTLAIAVMVFQLRVVTGTPKSRSNVPR